MPIAINGSGTITGLSAGGLPANSVTTATLADGAATKVKRTYAAGEIIQTKHLVYTAVDQSYTSSGWNATPVTAQITPVATSSKILVMATITMGNHSLGEGAAFKIMKSVAGGTYAETDSLGGDAGGGRGAVGGMFDSCASHYTDCRSIQFVDSPSTTSAIDYKVYQYLWDASKPARHNRPNTNTSAEYMSGASSIVLMEVAG